MPTATATAEPTAVPTPVGPDQPGDLVTGPYGCGDGMEGFAIWIPSGWYANSAHRGIPACRYAAPVPFGSSDLNTPALVPIRFDVRTGDFEPPDEVLARREVEIGGLPALRYDLRGEHGERIVYVIALDGELPSSQSSARYLAASTEAGDATLERDVAALDEMLSRFSLSEPFERHGDAERRADDLMAATEMCTNEEWPLVVQYPASWSTNASADGPACAYFGPGAIEGPGVDGMPGGAEISLTVFEGAVGSLQGYFSFESTNIGGRPAQRMERRGAINVESPDGRTYQYVAQLSDKISGRTFFAAVSTASASDYALAKAVLDRMLASVDFRQ